MTTLIIGCGYLGRRVGQRLVARGETVWGTTRSASKATELEKLGIRPLVADLLGPGPRPWPEAERVLFCVSADRSSGQSARAVYVDGLRAALGGLRAKTRVVLTSSTGVYGQADGSWVNEDSPTEPSSDSGRALLEAEGVLREIAGRDGLCPAIVRLAGLYGPGRIIRRAALERGEAIAGEPEHFLNLIHIDDAARVVEALLTRQELPRSLYVASDGHPVARRQFYEAVARQLGLPAPRFATGTPGARDASHKRVDSRRIWQDLGIDCEYVDYAAGIAVS